MCSNEENEDCLYLLWRSAVVGELGHETCYIAVTTRAVEVQRSYSAQRSLTGAKVPA